MEIFSKKENIIAQRDSYKAELEETKKALEDTKIQLEKECKEKERYKNDLENLLEFNKSSMEILISYMECYLLCVNYIEENFDEKKFMNVCMNFVSKIDKSQYMNENGEYNDDKYLKYLEAIEWDSEICKKILDIHDKLFE